MRMPTSFQAADHGLLLRTLRPVELACLDVRHIGEFLEFGQF